MTMRKCLMAIWLAAALATPVLAAEGGQPNIFGGGITNAIITAVIFLIVLVVLGKKAWPPLVKVLEEREQTIRGALEEAKRERQQAEALLAKYREQIDRAREEATAIVEEGRRDAEVVRRRLQEETRQEAAEMIERAKREIQLATEAALRDLFDRTAELAVDVAGGIIHKELSPADHKALVAESLERMKAQAKLN